MDSGTRGLKKTFMLSLCIEHKDEEITASINTSTYLDDLLIMDIFHL